MTYHRKTVPTTDPSAQSLNRQFCDIDRFAIAGRELNDILHDRFKDDLRQFKAWIAANLDRSPITCLRYIAIYKNITMLKRLGIIRPQDAYKVLDLNHYASILAAFADPTETVQ